MAEYRAIEILLVEDNPGDVRLTQEALAENKICNKLHVAKDGVEAMNFLRRMNGFRDAPRPDLILLDLNMPRKDGREVLAEIKADEMLRSIPVVVLTTSDADDDISRSYQMYANCFIRKPIDLGRFIEVIKIVESFWLTIVELPPRK